jgi:KRAB domain-containing zinc finger protein
MASELLAHEYWHDKEGDYICNFLGCEMRFTLEGSWRRHENTHAREKRYECVVCKRMFFRLHHLKKHKKTHSAVVSVIEDLKDRM